MTFTELLRNVGLFGAAVMCCLALLSIFSVAVMVDKYRRFRAAAQRDADFQALVRRSSLHGGEVQELIEAVQQHQKSHVAQVVSAGILEYDGVRQTGRDPVRFARACHERTQRLHVRNAGPIEAGSRVPGYDRLHGPVRRSLRYRRSESSTLFGTSRPRGPAVCL